MFLAFKLAARVLPEATFGANHPKQVPTPAVQTICT